jgi:3-phosphoinositide dependent protein kinase-1
MAVGGDDDMERDFAARLRLAHSPAPSSAPPASSSPAVGGIAFRAPQEQFTVEDFELGKIYGVGSYSKVVNFSTSTSIPRICCRGNCGSRGMFMFCCMALKWQVVRAKKKDTGNVYALKIMDKKFITKENKISYVKMERIVLDQLDHPGVIRLFFTFQDTYSLCQLLLNSYYSALRMRSC